jgi:uncharacterized protein (DUF433 family)
MDKDRPVIQIDPAMRFGRPHIKGVSTNAIAERVIAGESVDEVGDDYGLSRHEVLLACWWEGTGGEYRKEWKAWAEEVWPALGGWNKPFDADTLPDPPDEEELKGV